MWWINLYNFVATDINTVREFLVENGLYDFTQIDKKYVIGGVVGVAATLTGFRINSYVEKFKHETAGEKKDNQEAMEKKLTSYGFKKKNLHVIKYELAGLDIENFKAIREFAKTKILDQRFQRGFNGIDILPFEPDSRNLIIEVERPLLESESEIWLQNEISEKISRLSSKDNLNAGNDNDVSPQDLPVSKDVLQQGVSAVEGKLDPGNEASSNSKVISPQDDVRLDPN